MKITTALEASAVTEHVKLSVFADHQHQGSEAYVLLLTQPLAAATMRDMAREFNRPATCFAVARGEQDYEVRCFSPAGEIRCCGHGLLATAYVLHCGIYQQHDVGRQSLRLYQPGVVEPLQVLFEHAMMWLRLPKLGCRPVDVPAWVDEAFSVLPERAAVAGGEEGYLVLEYAPDTALADLNVRHSVITSGTQRAVIVSRQGTCKNYDFLLRYFAPQYGVDEDSVTGSANRVLADYWAERTTRKQFRALQCSAGGGVVETRVEDKYVWVGGRVAII